MHQPFVSKRRSFIFRQSRLTKQYSAPSAGSMPKSVVTAAASRCMPARMSCGRVDMNSLSGVVNGFTATPPP